MSFFQFPENYFLQKLLDTCKSAKFTKFNSRQKSKIFESRKPSYWLYETKLLVIRKDMATGKNIFLMNFAKFNAREMFEAHFFTKINSREY